MRAGSIKFAVIAERMGLALLLAALLSGCPYSMPLFDNLIDPECVISVLYNANGATSGYVPIDNTVYSKGSAITVAGNPSCLSKTGYALLCWNTMADGMGISYSPGDSFRRADGITILYARWIPSSGEVTIPYGITGIIERAFSNCYDLTGVSIPSSVTSIGNNAFWSCSALTSVTIPSSVKSIGYSAFGACMNLIGIFVDPANQYYHSIDGVMLDKSCDELITFPGGVIGAYSIPGTVSIIESSAFVGTRLTSVTIPANVSSIGYSVFSNCFTLGSVTLYRATPPALPANSYAFSYMNSGFRILVPSASVGAYRAAAGWSEYASIIVSM